MQPIDSMTVDRTVGYPVRDIMTRNPACWDGSAQSRSEILADDDLKEITYFPVIDSGVISGIITRDSLQNGMKPIQLTSKWLIVADTPILELISLFAQNPDQVFLVMEMTKIVGIVAPADLNKIPARASIYLLIAHFENELAEFVRLVLGTEDEVYANRLSSGRFRTITNRRNQDKSHDTQLSITHYFELFDFREIIKKEERLYTPLGFPIADAAGESKNKLHEEIDSKLNVDRVRNQVSHAANLLITSREQLQYIDKICSNLILFHQRIRQQRLGEGTEK